MSLKEAVSLALTSMKTGKMRSMLTLLGIIIGISSVITILTLGHALKTQTMGSLDSMGINNLNVQVQSREEAKESESDYLHSSAPIKDPTALISTSNIGQIQQRFPGDITGVMYSRLIPGQGDTEIVDAATGPLGTHNAKAVLVAGNEEYLPMSGVGIQHGRGLEEQDLSEARHVAVISPKVFKDLFAEDVNRALGSEIRFTHSTGTISLMVVGVSEDPKGGLLMGNMSEPTVVVPYPLQEMFSGEFDDATTADGFTSVSFRIAKGADKGMVKKELQNYFDRLYQSNEDYLAKVSDNEKDMEAINKVLGSISMAVAAIGGISLLVGGIGVMNVMLITVTERTREIGVRKALGARSRDIKLQFIIEAMIVCLIGGLIGVGLGSVFGMIGAQLMGEFVLPPVSAVIISLGFCLGIGLFFGYYPAAKAAKMNPIEALRYE